MTNRQRSRARFVVASLLVAVCAPAALADDILADDIAVAPLAEVPFTSGAFHGARAMGMGGVALAVVDGGSALVTNPAGLARLRRVEVSAALSRRTDEHAGSVLDDDFEVSLSATELSALRFAYPFPTFRGSLVFGLAAERVGDLNDDFYAVYEDGFNWSETDTVIGRSKHAEDLRAQGDLYAWTIGAAFDASERLSLGAAVSFWSGSMSHRFEKRVEDTSDVSAVFEGYTARRDAEFDLSGLRLSLGALYYASEMVTVGLLVDSPITVATDATIDTIRIWRTTTGEVTDVGTGYYSEDYSVPFTFAAGVAVQPTDLLVVGADIAFTDWAELERELELFADDPVRREDYVATTDVRVGAELSLPSWPIRLRGGYATRPIAYRGLDIDRDRAYFTLGAGFLVDTVLAIDVAWVKGGYERSSSVPRYEESVDDTAVLIEAAYRF